MAEQFVEFVKLVELAERDEDWPTALLDTMDTPLAATLELAMEPEVEAPPSAVEDAIPPELGSPDTACTDGLPPADADAPAFEDPPVSEELAPASTMHVALPPSPSTCVVIIAGFGSGSCAVPIRSDGAGVVTPIIG